MTSEIMKHIYCNILFLKVASTFNKMDCTYVENLIKIMLRNSVKETIDTVADSALLSRESNWDPDRYQENWIDDSNND